MTLCKATTQKGSPCTKPAQSGKSTCHVHKDGVVGSAKTQAKIVKFAEEAEHTFFIVSEMKQRFCTVDVQLPPDIARKIEDKEKRLEKWSEKVEKLARKSANENVDAKVDSVLEKFHKEKKKLFAIIVKHCKRTLSPAYVVPDYPPSLEIVVDMLRREGPTEMRYVNVVGLFFTVFLEWSVYGVAKTPDVIKYISDHPYITFAVVTYFSWKYPQQVGKKIPVYKEIIEMYETMYSTVQSTKPVVEDFLNATSKKINKIQGMAESFLVGSDLKGWVQAILATLAMPLKSISNFPNPLRVLADRILAKRAGQKGSRRKIEQVEQAKIDMAVRLWEHQKKLPPGLPMPDHILMMLEDDPGPLHVDNKTLSSYYYTGATMNPDVFSVLSMIGMVFLFFGRRFW